MRPLGFRAIKVFLTGGSEVSTARGFLSRQALRQGFCQPRQSPCECEVGDLKDLYETDHELEATHQIASICLQLVERRAGRIYLGPKSESEDSGSVERSLLAG